MIITGFLGFFYIAQNGFYSIQQIQKNSKKQVQLHYGKKNSIRSRLNRVNILPGIRYYSTNKNSTNNNLTNNTELDSIMIYDLLLEYSEKLKKSVMSTGKNSMPHSIYYITDDIDESVLILKNLEDSSSKTDPDTFKLIFELYIYVYVYYVEAQLKFYKYPEHILKSNFMTDVEKKVHIAINNYSQNYSKNKKEIKSNNIRKSEEIDSSIANYSVDSKNISKILKDFIVEKNLEPIYIYEDLNNVSIHKNILTETKGLSGIYLIFNKVTFDYYIGSASTNRINKRFANHLIHLTGSKVLKNAVKKYKLSEFAFLILEIYPEIITVENNKKLLDLEDFYLKSLLPNYNILTEAGSSFGYKHSELSRIKMKANYSQDRRDKIGSLNRNKPLSFETIEFMREKALNRIKPIYSEQAKENMKKASKSILVYNLDGTIHAKYLSIKETSENLNCSAKTIYGSLKSITKCLKGRSIVNFA